MKHESKFQFSIMVIIAFSLAKYTGLHISLALPRPQENISASTLLHHTFCNIVVLVFIKILFQLLPPVLIKNKMCPDLVGYICQIGIDRQCILRRDIADWPDIFGLCADWFHNPHLIHNPYDRRFPIDTLRNSFQRLIGRKHIAELFSSHSCNRIRPLK